MSQAYEQYGAGGYAGPGERAEQGADEETLRNWLLRTVVDESIGRVGLLLSADFTDAELDSMRAARQRREEIVRGRNTSDTTDVKLASSWEASGSIVALDKYSVRRSGGYGDYGEWPMGTYDSRADEFRDKAWRPIGKSLQTSERVTRERLVFVDDDDEGEKVEVRYGLRNDVADGSGRIGNRIALGFALSRRTADMLYAAVKVDPSLAHEVYRQQSIALGIPDRFWRSSMAPQHSGHGYPVYPPGLTLRIGSYDADLGLREQGEYPFPTLPARRRQVGQDADFVAMWNGERDVSAVRMRATQRSAEVGHWFHLTEEVERLADDGVTPAEAMLHVILDERQQAQDLDNVHPDSVPGAEARGRWDASFQFANRHFDTVLAGLPDAAGRLAFMMSLLRATAMRYVTELAAANGGRLPDDVPAPTFDAIGQADLDGMAELTAEVMMNLQDDLVTRAANLGAVGEPQAWADTLIGDALRLAVTAQRATAAAGAAGVRGATQQ